MSSRAALVLGLVLTFAIPRNSGGDDKETVPLDGEYPRLLEQSTEAIRDALKDKPSRRTADKARIAAVMIAAAAQRNLTGSAANQRAAVRDAALAVADLIKKEDFAQARRRMAELPRLKPDARAKPERVKLAPRLDVEDLMMQFRPAMVWKPSSTSSAAAPRAR
jgi:hypothetical protein